MADSEKVQFNIYLPRDLVTKIKHHAIDEGLSLSALIERVMWTHLDDAKETSR